MAAAAGQELEGYEIHAGQTVSSRPWLQIIRRNGAAADIPDGAVSTDGRIWGCYLHGLFANPALRRAWLARLEPGWAVGRIANPSHVGPRSLDLALDRLADAVEAALDMQKLTAIVG